MGFAEPTLLWALAAIGLPVAIHLLSRGPGRRVWIGSVRLLAGRQSRAARRLRARDLPLMALRCLLIGALAVALAGPRWSQGGGRSAVRPIVLVDPGLNETGPLGGQQAVDRLEEILAERRARGEELRWLAPGLPSIAEHSTAPPTTVTGGVWSLVAEADQRLDPGPFVVFARDDISLYPGPRPQIRRPVEWSLIGDTEGKRWLTAIGVDADGGIVATAARRREGSVRVQRITETEIAEVAVGSSTAAVPGLDRSPEGTVTARWAASSDTVASRLSLPAEREPGLRASVLYDSSRRDEARFAVAALRSAAGLLALPLTLSTVDVSATAESSSIGIDHLVFWLGSGPPPDSELLPGAVLVAGAAGGYRPCETYVLLGPAARPVAVRRCGELATDANDRVLWRTVDGLPLLVERGGGRSRLELALRLDPQWSDLVVDSAFPAWVASLLEDQASRAGLVDLDGDRDGRAVDPAVLPTGTPEMTSALGGGPSPLAESLAWLAVLGLFVAERRLAARVADGVPPPVRSPSPGAVS